MTDTDSAVSPIGGVPGSMQARLDEVERRVDAHTTGGAGSGMITFDYKFWLTYIGTLLAIIGITYGFSTAYTDAKVDSMEKRFEQMDKLSGERFDRILERSEAHTNAVLQDMEIARLKRETKDK